ncbi:MAG: type II restriction endonuclease [Acidobacteria bacterium]|nr:type II restriction endonuclease [Acidobacteriota bacterium]
MRSLFRLLLLLSLCAATFTFDCVAQTASAELGSETAKNGFKNEDQIRDKFNAWKTDPDAQAWLATMGFDPKAILTVFAVKPSGQKSDVDVTVETKAGKRTEGISIKLVSSPHGFNQIDKRWLAHYVKMWSIPSEVESALKLFCGETPPTKPGRSKDRMFLDELQSEQQKAIIDFFTTHRQQVLHDLFRGDGLHAATWFMVAWKPGDRTTWVLRRDEDVEHFFGDGKIDITSGGNLKIGKITVQRKGGDAGRDTGKMLQFKINPALLFDGK